MLELAVPVETVKLLVVMVVMDRMLLVVFVVTIIVDGQTGVTTSTGGVDHTGKNGFVHAAELTLVKTPASNRIGP
jgi:hypothetical protein